MASQRKYLFLSIGLSLLSLAVLANAQEATVDAGQENFQAPNRLIDSLEGRDLFRAYCAACHGADARGGGPQAASLRVRRCRRPAVAGYSARPSQERGGSMI